MREGELSLSLLSCCFGSVKAVLCVCMGSKRFMDKVRLMGEVDGPIRK